MKIKRSKYYLRQYYLDCRRNGLDHGKAMESVEGFAGVDAESTNEKKKAFLIDLNEKTGDTK